MTLNLANDFLGMIPKVQRTKEKIAKLNFIKCKIFVLQRTPSRK